MMPHAIPSFSLSTPMLILGRFFFHSCKNIIIFQGCPGGHLLQQWPWVPAKMQTTRAFIRLTITENPRAILWNMHWNIFNFLSNHWPIVMALFLYLGVLPFFFFFLKKRYDLQTITLTFLEFIIQWFFSILRRFYDYQHYLEEVRGKYYGKYSYVGE